MTKKYKPQPILTPKEKILKDFEGRRKQAYRDWKSLNARKVTFTAFLEAIPEKLLEERIDTYFYRQWDSHGIAMVMPYDMTRYVELRNLLEEAGFETDQVSTTNTDTYYYFKHPSFPGYDITINLDARKRGSKCVLVPIEWETRIVAKTVDKICPEGHPELFKKNDETGELEYVGDGLFPKPPEGIEIR